ncbi:hypothetical protein [Halorubrum sp. T3]|uniref:hypothetical protein n=1 Tax=Halorubrum sp. T3 TaxID=1194088 RepID=UPI00036EC559|nr:hypothetical protein [Halorubrum sp. T3]
MNRVRAVLSHVWEVSIIAVLFMLYVVGLTGATILWKAKRLTSQNSGVENELAKPPRA